MKKVFAVILAVAMIMCLSVSAFAALSPEDKPVYKVTVINGIDAKSEVKSIDEGSEFTVTSDANKGKFDFWRVYKKDGTVAKEGVDYTVKTGKLEESPISIIPKADIIVTGNYDGKLTDPLTGKEMQDKSPATGDFSVVYIFALGALALAGVAKKQLSK